MTTMGSQIWPAQEAVYARFIADSSFMTALGVSGPKPYAVFSTRAPKGTAKPYVTFGSPSEHDFDIFKTPGKNGTLQIDIWSDKTTNEEVLVLYAHVERLLNRVSLSVGGGISIRGRVELVMAITDDDGVTMHGVVLYRFLTVA